MIIAMDGTTGSGKSTIAKELAKRLDFAYVRTGSFYRAIALKMMRKNISKDNLRGITTMLSTTSIVGKYQNGHFLVWLDGENVSDKINTPEVSSFVSTISPIESIRVYVRRIQRSVAQTCKNLVMEGRDIGSVIFPNAELKVYVDCNILMRAKRRVRQYQEKGIVISIGDAKKQIEERDWQDIHRATSPLVRLPEAFYLDTTHMNIEGCVQILINQVEYLRSKR